MVVRMRHNRSQTRSRRSHRALLPAAFFACPHCGAKKEKHAICPNCGKYHERDMIDVIGKRAMKAAKKKEKQAAPATAEK
ncbi:50S ribosomal protein L32 [Patescibacteria group bacterium]|nr:MAG: 50S ribosomal protein L32 [Patescibacteria group bacterium]